MHYLRSKHYHLLIDTFHVLTYPFKMNAIFFSGSHNIKVSLFLSLPASLLSLLFLSVVLMSKCSKHKSQSASYVLTRKHTIERAFILRHIHLPKF